MSREQLEQRQWQTEFKFQSNRLRTGGSKIISLLAFIITVLQAGSSSKFKAWIRSVAMMDKGTPTPADNLCEWVEV